MLRKMMSLAMVAVFAALAIGCGSDTAEPGALKSGDVAKAQTQLQDLQSEMAEVRRQVNETIVDLETEQMRLQARLKEVQAGFEKLNARTAILAGALQGAPKEAKAQQAKAKNDGKPGWSWQLKTLIAIVIVILIALFFRRHTHADEEEDDAEFEDDEIVENTDLGEIRYPGTSSEETDRDRDTEEKPPRQD